MASNDLERLVVQLSADITRYERSLARANGVTNTRARAMENRFKQMQTRISGSFSGISAGATRALAAIGGAQGFKSLSDAGTSIDNALKTAGLSGDALEKTYNSLRQAALQNAAPIQSLVQLYGRLSLVQGELGVSSQQIEGFSKNVAIALRAGGTSAAEASGALLQFSQALGAGVVRAEEFNSIQEGAPSILQAAAAGIEQAGGSVAKLRKLMLDGKLSSKAFFDGFQAGVPVLEERVAGSVFTIAQRLENLQTALINSVRDFNKSTGAASSFGSEIERVTAFVSSVNFNALISQLQSVYGAFNTATGATAGFLARLGELGGFQGLANDILQRFGDGNGGISVLGGGLTIKPSNPKGFEESREKNLVRLAEQRLSLEQEIDKVKGSSLRDDRKTAVLADQQKRLADIKARQDDISNSIINGSAFNPLTGTPNVPAPEAKPLPKVDITKPQYQVDADAAGGGSKSKAARKERLDDYSKEVVRIREKTDALNAETEAQAKINPLINDYGYAVAFAAAQQELTNAAIEAGKQVTPELAAEIDKLADAYALSGVASEKLAESQDKIKQRQQEILDVQKDVTRGFVDDLLAGTSAADAFNNALKKIASTLLDQAFTQFFNPQSSGGVGGFGGLLSLIGFASGGYTGPGGQYQPAGVVHRGEYVVPKNVVDKLGVKNLERAFGGYANGGLVNSGLSRSSPATSLAPASGAINAVYSPQIDARGASVEAVARLERIIETDRRNFSARVENTVVKARAANKKGF